MEHIVRLLLRVTIEDLTTDDSLRRGGSESAKSYHVGETGQGLQGRNEHQRKKKMKIWVFQYTESGSDPLIIKVQMLSIDLHSLRQSLLEQTTKPKINNKEGVG